MLDEESSMLTTFITQWGRYRFLRCPQGCKCSGDAYTHRTDDAFIDVLRKEKIVDDTNYMMNQFKMPSIIHLNFSTPVR